MIDCRGISWQLLIFEEVVAHVLHNEERATGQQYLVALPLFENLVERCLKAAVFNDGLELLRKANFFRSFRGLFIQISDSRKPSVRACNQVDSLDFL